MLINIIHKGSLPDSNSTTYRMGGSLSDILFSFVLEKYIVYDVCGLRSPSFEYSSELYISPTYTSSMQYLILQGLQQKLQKSCSRCNKNTWHVVSSYILQPPKYLLLFVNRFRYVNNNVTKDRCPIPMDTTVRLGLLKFSLRATIDHQGQCIQSGHYTASINCCKKHSFATITQLRSLELLTAKTPLLHMLYYMNWLTHDFWTRTGRGTGAETCGLDNVFPPDDLCQALCWYIYIYIYMLFYLSSVFFGLPIVSCSLMIIV